MSYCWTISNEIVKFVIQEYNDDMKKTCNRFMQTEKCTSHILRGKSSTQE